MDTQTQHDLEDFVSRSREIHGTRIAELQPTHDFHMRWESGGPMVFTSSGPDMRDVRELAIVLRPFLMGEDRIGVFRIYKVCRDHLQDPQWLNGLTQAHTALKAAMKGAGVRVEIDEVVWTPRRVMHILMNGYFAHWDRQKRQELERMWPPFQMLLKHQFGVLLNEAARVITYMAAVIHKGLQEGLFR